jgi:hypothetical protein
MIKFILGSLLATFAGLGTYYIVGLFNTNPLILTIGICFTILGFLAYVSLWYSEMDAIEHSIIGNKLHEDRIPVIGARPIDWEHELDMPIYDINHPIKFDRNKIIYNPKKPF